MNGSETRVNYGVYIYDNVQAFFKQKMPLAFPF